MYASVEKVKRGDDVDSSGILIECFGGRGCLVSVDILRMSQSVAGG